MKKISKSPKETESIAAELARELRGGECVALYGDLGAGKTQFVRGLARGLGANPRRVSSPTFVLLNVYSGKKLKLFHLDAYRVTGEEDFEGIGFGEMLDQGAIVVVEWAERIEKILPSERVEVRIKNPGRNDERRIEIIERSRAVESPTRRRPPRSGRRSRAK
jgi:tRNA threonylcarbamoyladenosine biosynthesis protein TsaE